MEEGLAISNIPSHDQDLERRDAMVMEAQRQQAECYRRLQQAEGEVAQLRMKLEAVNKRLEEVENEKAHMDVQLCVYVKDFEVERSAREKQAEMIDNLQKKLAESKGDTNTLRREINRQSSIIRKVCLTFNLHLISIQHY